MHLQGLSAEIVCTIDKRQFDGIIPSFLLRTNTFATLKNGNFLVQDFDGTKSQVGLPFCTIDYLGYLIHFDKKRPSGFESYSPRWS